MPSKAFELVESIIKAGQDGPPPDLAIERRQAADHAAMYQAVPGVHDEPVDVPRADSYLMTPDNPRDDLVILYVHGGGFRSGTAAVARPIAAQLALHTKARVLLPEYRLAPEHPFPAGLDDCVAAFEHAATIAPRIVVAGESAGANLAMAVLLARAACDDHRALAGVLFSGVFDLRAERYTSGSWVDRADTDLVLGGADDAMSTDYLGGHPADDPLVSPLLADLSAVPPLFIQASSAERLLDDSLELAARAARAGVHTEIEVWPTMTHAWQLIAGFLPEATEAAARASAFVNRIGDGRMVDGAALMGGPATLEGAL
ncbi:alpha/beta hydrolase fold domain-containing protein [Streptodolium elevatio]